jgi:hypothetical protein
VRGLTSTWQTSSMEQSAPARTHLKGILSWPPVRLQLLSAVFVHVWPQTLPGGRTGSLPARATFHWDNSFFTSLLGKNLISTRSILSALEERLTRASNTLRDGADRNGPMGSYSSICLTDMGSCQRAIETPSLPRPQEYPCQPMNRHCSFLCSSLISLIWFPLSCHGEGTFGSTVLLANLGRLLEAPMHSQHALIDVFQM